MTKMTSVRLDDDLAEKLEALAKSVDRPKTWVIEQAVRGYVEEQAWQVKKIEEAMRNFKSGRAKLIPHEEVMDKIEAKIKSKMGR